MTVILKPAVMFRQLQRDAAKLLTSGEHDIDIFEARLERLFVDLRQRRERRIALHNANVGSDGTEATKETGET